MTADKYKAIGNRIRSAREATGMTQGELAQAVGCTPQHMGILERGLKLPKLETLVTIANALGTSSDLLLQDVLEHPVDTVAGEFAAAIAPLAEPMKIRVLNALRVFAQVSQGNEE